MLKNMIAAFRRYNHLIADVHVRQLGYQVEKKPSIISKSKLNNKPL